MSVALPGTTRDLAQAARVTEWTARQWCVRGRVPAIKVGKDWRINAAVIEAIAAGRDPKAVQL